MPSDIDATKPEQGNATTLSVRENFAAAKAEILALQGADTTINGRIDTRAERAGDIGGTATSSTVVALQNRAVSGATPAPVAGQALTWNATPAPGAWQPSNVLQLQGVAVSATAPTNGQQLRYSTTAPAGWVPATNTVTLSGDATGTADASAGAIATTVERIRGRNLATTPAPTGTQVLTYDGTNWVPSDITQIRGRNLSATPPTSGQALVFDGTNWTPTSTAATTPGVPAGGITGQILGKTSGTDYDMAWQNGALQLTTARNITIDPTITTPASFNGTANVSAGPSLAIAAGTATITLPVTTALSLSSWLGTARNNLDWLNINKVTQSRPASGTNLMPLNSIGIGTSALGTGSGNNQIGIGNRTMANATTASYNVAIGINAGETITGGNNNIAIGYLAFATASHTGNENVAIGTNALMNCTSSGVIAIGEQAGAFLTSSAYATIIGARAFGNRTDNPISMTQPCGMGFRVYGNLTSGNYNTGFGYSCGEALLTGSGNVLVGNRVFAQTTEGTENTMMGYWTGHGNTNWASGGTACSQCVCIGSRAMPSQGGANIIAIGYGANGNGAAPNNTVTLGNASIAQIRCQVTTITPLSDRRIKQNIESANLDKCLDAVKAIPVRRYQLNPDMMGERYDRTVTGFIADDVERVFPHSVNCTDEVFNGRVMKKVKNLSNENALPTLWGAVQQIAERLERLEEKLNG